MSSNVTAIERNEVTALPDNIEELAAEARKKREQRCNEAINKVLQEHNCQMSVCFQIGNQMVPVAQVITFPGVIIIGSK